MSDQVAVTMRYRRKEAHILVALCQAAIPSWPGETFDSRAHLPEEQCFSFEHLESQLEL